MKIETMTERLRQRAEYGLSEDEVIKLSFAVILQSVDITEKSRAAVILSGIVKKGLGQQTK